MTGAVAGAKVATCGATRVGLAVALNTPQADQKPGEAAASVSGSIVINCDVAQAHIDDSAITGVSGGSGRDVELTACNAPRSARVAVPVAKAAMTMPMPLPRC